MPINKETKRNQIIILYAGCKVIIESKRRRGAFIKFQDNYSYFKGHFIRFLLFIYNESLPCLLKAWRTEKYFGFTLIYPQNIIKITYILNKYLLLIFFQT